MFRVTVVGETPAELKKKLVALAESFSSGKKIITTQEEFEAAEVVDEEDEMTEVESPYVGKPSAAQYLGSDGSDGSDVDSEGLPWDARIHSSSKGKIKSGRWKLKKGVDDSEIAKVKAELYGNSVVENAAPVAAPTVVTPVVAQPTIAATPAVVQAAPPMPTMQMQTGGHTVATFCSNFPHIMATLITEGKITQDWINNLKAHFGLAELWDFTDAHKSQVFDLLVQHNLVTRVG